MHLFSRVFSWQLSRVNRREFLATSISSALAVATANTKQSSPVPLPPAMPQPKFWFGQRVVLEYELDDELDSRDGQTFRDYGHIIGMVYQASGDYIDPQKHGWIYWVRWYELGADDFTSPPYTYQAREEELEAV
ncbi:MAG TPA: hypothetical protein VK203_01410 [Nostocaceae cyanobacterium]|nr:hypothetical protein [Nostocaceae cyanobacterium]